MYFFKTTIIISFVFSLVALFLPTSSSAETNVNSIYETGLIELRRRIPVSNRPKAPSRQHVMCEYDEGMLNFEFYIPEGNCTLLLTDLDSGQTQMACFNSDAPVSVYVGAHAQFSIEISTDAGNVYEGQFPY